MRTAAALVAAMVVIHLLLAAHLGLAEDEAYYWVWGQHLAAGYYDHPPVIAWLIRGGSELAGGELGVRLLPVLLGGVAALLVAPLCDEPRLSAAMLVTMPLLALGGVLATPDAPLVAAWALGLWAAARERWWVVGLAAGLAMLSKYTGVLLLPLVVLARPGDLRTRDPWLAAGVALLVYSPNAIWNLAHDGASWRFQLRHVADEANRLDFVAAQAGLAGPLVFLAAVAWMAVGWRGDRVERLAWWTSVPVLAIAIWAGGEANWAAPAWLSAAVGLCRRGGRWRRVQWVGVGVSGALSALVLVHAWRPVLALADDPLDRLVGGRDLADAVAAWGVEPVYTSRYQEAALIAFYAGIPAHKLPGQGRLDQYDLWPAAEAEPGQKVLFVRPWRGGASTEIEAAGWERGSPNVVSAYANTTDPLSARVVARWQVYEAWK